MIFLIGGGKGIRTPAPLARPVGFQDRSLQPDLGIPPRHFFKCNLIIAKRKSCVNNIFKYNSEKIAKKLKIMQIIKKVNKKT